MTYTFDSFWQRTSYRVLRFTIAVAICAVALARPSKADVYETFNVSGTFTVGSMNGTTTFDETTNKMISVDINAPGTGSGPFTTIGGLSPTFDSAVGTIVGLNDGLGDYLFLEFPTATAGNVAGYHGGPLLTESASPVIDGTVIDYASGSQDFLTSGSLTPAPEPSTISLLSLTLLGLGILGYKMRRA